MAGTLCTSEKISRQPDCRNKSAQNKLRIRLGIVTADLFRGFRNEYTAITAANIGARSMISGKRKTSVSRVQHSLSKKHDEPHEENFHRADGAFHFAYRSFFPLLYLPNSVHVSTKVRQCHYRCWLTPPTLSFYS